jgi:hypothetical protein
MHRTAAWKLDDELRLFLINELMMTPSFVHAIEPVLRIVQNLHDLYDIGKWDLLNLMHWCMTNLPAIGHDESWVKDNVDNFRRIYTFVKYIDEQLCLPDDQGVRPDITMAVLQRFNNKNYRKLLARSGGQFHAKFFKAWKLFAAGLREKREDNHGYLAPSHDPRADHGLSDVWKILADALRDIHACNPDYLVPSEQASNFFVGDVAFRRGYGDAEKPPFVEEDFVDEEDYNHDLHADHGFSDAVPAIATTDRKLVSAHSDPTLKTGEPQLHNQPTGEPQNAQATGEPQNTQATGEPPNTLATSTTRSMRKGESTPTMANNLRFQVKAVEDADVNDNEDIPASYVTLSSVLPELWCQHAGYEPWKFTRVFMGFPFDRGKRNGH